MYFVITVNILRVQRLYKSASWSQPLHLRSISEETVHLSGYSAALPHRFGLKYTTRIPKPDMDDDEDQAVIRARLEQRTATELLAMIAENHDDAPFIRHWERQLADRIEFRAQAELSAAYYKFSRSTEITSLLDFMIQWFHHKGIWLEGWHYLPEDVVYCWRHARGISQKYQE